MSINIKKTELEDPSKNFDYAHNIAYDYIGYEGEEYVHKDLKIFKDSYNSILQRFNKLNEYEKIYLKTLFQLFVNYLEMNWVIKLSTNKSFECFPKKRLTKKSIQINLRKSKQRNIRKYTNLISTVQSPKSKPNKSIFEIISSFLSFSFWMLVRMFHN